MPIPTKDNTHLVTPAFQQVITAAAALVADCVGAVDDERFDEWSTFFTEDCRYDITTREARLKGWPIGLMHCAGAAMLRDRIMSMRHANIFEAHHYRHMVSATRLAPGTDRAPDFAAGVRVHTNFGVTRIMANGDTTFFGSGFFDDLIVATPGGLRFRERTVVLDSSQVDTLIVVPF
jgi:anthranilate 1,2-dioxygenase small subunit